MQNREGALARAATFFDDGSYKKLLTDLVAIPSTAQEPGHEADCAIIWKARLGLGWKGWALPSAYIPIRWKALARF